MPGKAIRARGVVQGVGFRPAIWHLARQFGLTGSVWNDGEGVMIHAFGNHNDLDEFVRQIPLQLPPLARLDSLQVIDLAGRAADSEFRIVASQNNGINTPIAADAATCPDCLAEIADPNNRRYRYPFTNCTHCGPRLSIVERVPYDRCHTSMAVFPICPECQCEYDDPADRRFHAQANCCPACGPKLWLEEEGGRIVNCDDPLTRTVELIRQGYIVAIKGLGGFHLACNAVDADAVNRLRQRKRRYAKPFALMARDVDMVSRYAVLSDAESVVLSGKAAPIVLLQANAEGNKMPAGVAPDTGQLGFMLPYTPLHTLLMQALSEPIVLTSGNISDEPQCTGNDAARSQLNGIADYWLLHERAIVNRLDDSVLRWMAGGMRVLRRARGYAPETLPLPTGFEHADGVLAMGAELKNTFCLLKNGQAIVSQHIGDLESAAVQHDYRNNLDLYRQLFGFQPKCIAIDRHPGYLSSQYGQVLAADEQLPVIPVQHHHAHLAACLAEHAIAKNMPPVLAAIFDGLGLGDDGEIWGGEFLLGNYHGYRRLGHMQTIALPGGTQAMREPWRNTYAQLRHYFDWPTLQQDYASLDIIRLLTGKPLTTLDTMIEKRLNSPLSSSCGRWFDAFAAALGLHAEAIDYEGQAAIALETLAASVMGEELPYTASWTIENQRGMLVLNWRGLWLSVLDDIKHDIPKSRIAARIHLSLAGATVDLLMQLSRTSATDTIVLSGGVFQNRLLLEAVARQLQQNGKTVLLPGKLPMNDGGLALGQALIAAAR